MRISLKIRDAKRKLPELMECYDPIHFGDADTYLDFILGNLIYLIHGSLAESEQLIIYYEYRVRMGEDIKSHYIYTI